MTTFTGLGVQKQYVEGLKELGITKPTEVQEAAIPYLLQNNADFIGLAQTGTGKTAAYGLPVLHKIDASKDTVQALILSPTRELVQQIKKQLFKFTKYVDDKIFIEAVYGGEKIDRQINNLKRTTHVIVATPGRLIDLIERGEVNLKDINTLVLDEADEMLSMGFKLDLNRILKYTSGTRKTWLFSATMPDEIRNIIKKYMDPSAKQVEVNKNALVNANITHQFIQTTIPEKVDVIVKFLEKRPSERGIIFARTKAGVQKLTKLLQDDGFSVAALEGDMQQRDREKVMRAFKNESLQILVSTDVAARGIDVRDLGFVVHHQLPEQLEYYTHRSGRTARAGKKGVSLVLILNNERNNIKEVERTLQIKFSEINI
ncbi:DEAD/DEAH box helicase [Tenacibaculum finnmarkense genomovar finnmarkense]|uniref:DEAD/DEAH box helicase n=1 Tax=Tenacibaculum finnmarkense TaxID=2781243 RepID=UPI001E458F77|nr:DEAD/DEAH box helicase [Tenacibaculum finnmarkense]MCD8416899.1 DEAD/DEAH box helicase [Tenacibaculum finnmarkense genomovar finnmarkense]MCG8185462.1 DEAD/DEAH box helicase [Tenacibaculum finnmarkense genomovar finnmarkense]MCG8201846.1 DEAD/DEAH box helicase [Tenacibaculum finnmarkense genomovar finnmarkense]MCG8209405.1 DEAD/DEAH box helicase [Tenacibaculum finnmarkense genomovar finnmarkense]MCG8212201.1 DEAD/DEAH box helicase [Tenacibaculum finnmarkense genomovar finnmarkense]